MNSAARITTVLGAFLTPVAFGQFLPHQWDLRDGRTLDVRFMVNGQHASPDTIAVNRAPGNPEPDPTGDGIFTFGDAVIRAMQAWNHANGMVGWNLNLVAGGGVPTNPVINVKLDSFTFPIAQPPHRGASADAIALFVPRTYNEAGKLVEADILFNVRMGVDQWGIGKNQIDDTDDDFKFDPINVALHEFGHAFRLDHPALGGTLTRANSGNSSVMLPLTDAGVHRLNPNPGAGFNRYPHVTDIAGAHASLPAPGPLTLAITGFALIARRRR